MAESTKLKIIGLKALAGDSKYLNSYKGQYIQINYDISDGRAWGDYFESLGQNSWKEYHNSNIINCGNISCKHTMNEIRDIITRKVEILTRAKHEEMR